MTVEACGAPRRVRPSVAARARRAGLNLARGWRRLAAAPSRPASPWLVVGRLGPVEIGTLGVSAVLASLVFLDAPALHWARALDPAVRAAFEAVTHLGRSDWVLIPLAVAALALAAANGSELPRRTRAVLAAWAEVLCYPILVVAGSGLIATMLKRVIGRARPKHFDALGVLDASPFAIDASFASFPSGHVTTVFAFAAAVAFLVPRLRYPAFAVAFWLGLSRAVVEAHYLSDAVAGALLALGFALWARSVFARKGLVFTACRAGGHRLKSPALLTEGWRILTRAGGPPVPRASARGSQC